MEQKLKLKNKSRKKEISILSQNSESSRRLAIHAVQKQLQVLKLKEWLMLFGFIGGAALLRIPMQAVPSAEPLTFFAILAGWLFGRNKGFIAGASSLYISNFFMFGGQGPWTPFQALGFGIAGWLGGLLRKNASYLEVITITLIGTLAFEIIINSFTPLMMGISTASIFTVFALALPFVLVHLVSNFIFSLALPSAKKFIEKKGGFDEREICAALLNKHNIHRKLSWVDKLRKRAKPSRQDFA